MMRKFQSFTDCTYATDSIAACKATPQTQVAEATLLAQHNRNERCDGGASDGRQCATRSCVALFEGYSN